MENNVENPKPVKKSCDFCKVALFSFFFMLGVLAGAVWAGMQGNCLQ